MKGYDDSDIRFALIMGWVLGFIVGALTVAIFRG